MASSVFSSDEEDFFDAADDLVSRNSLDRTYSVEYGHDVLFGTNQEQKAAREEQENRNIIVHSIASVNITADENEELAALLRAKEEREKEKQAAELKLKAAEELYEKKQAETYAQQVARKVEKESQKRLASERDERVKLEAQAAELRAMEAESLAQENEQLRKKLMAMRESLSRDSSLPQHHAVPRKSSLARAKAALSETSAEQLVQDIVLQETQELMLNLDSERKGTINKNLGIVFSDSPAGISALRRPVVSTSTPVIINSTIDDNNGWTDSALSNISGIASCSLDQSKQPTQSKQVFNQSEATTQKKVSNTSSSQICDTPTRGELYVDLTTAPDSLPPSTSDSQQYKTCLPQSLYETANQPSLTVELPVESASTSASSIPSSAVTTDSSTEINVRLASLSQEPDVVVSTRSNSLKREEMPTDSSINRVNLPQAPPRKCKTKSATDRPISDASEIGVCIGLPPMTPSASTEDVSRPGLLNLKTATLGKRHVNTQDADKEAGMGQMRSPLSDEELLALTPMTNLDTGETIKLSEARDRVPHTLACPLSLHMLKLAQNEAGVVSPTGGEGRSDGEGSVSGRSTSSSSTQRSFKRGSAKLKRFLGKAVHKVKTEVKGREETTLVMSEDEEVDDAFVFRGTASKEHRGHCHFDKLRLVQDMSGEHSGPVWALKFSTCGRLLATGGQDAVIRVWTLKESYAYFDDMRQKYNETRAASNGGKDSDSATPAVKEPPRFRISDEEESPFMNRIFMSYRGHTADVLDLSWSKNYFLLSSSMDKTVRLWHISRLECLCCFQHIDFVTAIAFHPKDDRYFLSGSLDGKLRLWSIPDKKVALWNEVTAGASRLITAVNFCQNGRFAVVGTYDGRCVFYNTEQLKYFTSINVRSSRGKNAQGHKVTAIQPLIYEDKILVTTNDSRLRLYDLQDLSLTCKYRGCTNTSSQIKAGFSHDGRFILCGSEDHNIYFWKTYQEANKFSASRRDRNDSWESVKVHNAIVTAAIFAPQPNLFFNARNPCDSLQSNDTLLVGKMGTSDSSRSGKSSVSSLTKTKSISLSKKHGPAYGYVIITADYTGSIKVLLKSNDKLD